MTGTKGIKGARRVSRSLTTCHQQNFRLPPNIHTLTSISTSLLPHSLSKQHNFNVRSFFNLPFPALIHACKVP